MSKIIRNNFCKGAYTTFLYLGAHQEGSLTHQTQIARALRKPITTINYHITKFKQEGLIDKQLKLTSRGKRLFEKLWKDKSCSYKFRAHNLQVKLNIAKCPLGFPNCFSNNIRQPFTNGKYSGIKTTLDDITIMFYSRKKIVAVLPDIFSDTIEEIGSAIALLCSTLKERIESEFEGVIIDSHDMAAITTMHVAKMDSEVAEMFVSTNGNYKSKKIEIDQSKGRPEIETVDGRYALADMEVVEEMHRIKEMIKNPAIKEQKMENTI